MDIRIIDEPSKCVGALGFNVIAAGYGEIDKNWSDVVKDTPYSRFYIVTGGEFFIITEDGERLSFTEGNAYLIPSGMSYEFGCEREMRHIYFHVQLSSFDNIDRLSKIERPLMIKPSLPYSESELISMTVSGDPADFFRIETEVRKIIADMLRENHITLEKSEYSPEIQSVIDYVGKNLSARLGISELAKAASLAKSTLTRRFRIETGKSIGEYIDGLLMFRAERAVLLSDDTVLEISDRFGFCDQFYFSRKFKEKYGESPREYRKRRHLMNRTRSERERDK